MADVDDGSIGNDARLFRRIRPDQIVDDQNAGVKRPSTGAFTDENLSVDAEPLLIANGLDHTFSLKGYTNFALVAFPASAARDKQLAVIPKPLNDNPAHTEVNGKKSYGVQKHLVRSCDWVP